MALSNILREPRREITETVIGFALVGGYLIGDCRLASYVGPTLDPDYPKDWFADIVVLMAIGLLLTVLSVPLMFFIHFVGEEVCNALRRRGLDPRPVRRVR